MGIEIGKVYNFAICTLQFALFLTNSRTASSPRTTVLQSFLMFLSAMAFKITSGPTPAGSPMVIAMVGFISTVRSYEFVVWSNYFYLSTPNSELITVLYSLTSMYAFFIISSNQILYLSSIIFWKIILRISSSTAVRDCGSPFFLSITCMI